MRAVEEMTGELEALVLDVREVGDVSAIAVRMIEDLHTDLAAAGCRVALVDPDAKLGHLESSLDPHDPRAGLHRP